MPENRSKNEVEEELSLQEPLFLCEATHPGDVSDLCVSH